MSTSDGEGPAWNKFWMSLDNETESMMSGEGGSRPPHTPDHRSLMSPTMDRPGIHDRGDSVLPNESASHHGAETPEHSALGRAASPPIETVAFPFKFKAPSGRMHRLQVVASDGMADLVLQVGQKLGSEAETIGGIPEVVDGTVGKTGFALSYLDNEGDTVSITTDRDLLEAINLAHKSHREKVDLFVHDPEQPAIPATLDPQPALPKPPTPPESVLRERRRHESDEEDEEYERRRRSRNQPTEQEQLIAGVPNELLLPGAIVTLAVVIVGVFALSRTSR